MKNTELIFRALEKYNTGSTLGETASFLRIHRNTVWRWIKKYQKDGLHRITQEKVFNRNWRRMPPSLEGKIATMKEKSPDLTVRKARQELKEQGHDVSIKGIWSVWQRYGFTGFQKKQFSPSYREYIKVPSNTQPIKENIEQLINDGYVNQAATLVNALPVFPFPEILKRIPEGLLSLTRQLDHLSSNFGAIPLSQYQQKAHQLRIQLEKKSSYYSAIRAGIDEGYALMWLGKPKELMQLVAALKKRAAGVRDPGLCFSILLLEGHELASFLKISDAIRCTHKCKIYIRNIPDPHIFMGELAGLYSLLGYYRDAIYWTRQAMGTASTEYRKRLLASLAGFLTTSGDYGEAMKILKQLHADDWNYQSRVLLMRAFSHLNKGNFREASSLATKALLQAKKDEIRRFFHLATFILACCHAAQGDKKEAQTILKKFNPILKKFRLEKEYILRKLVLADIRIPKNALQVPNLKLAHLFLKAKQTLRARDYFSALAYARRHGLFGLFERLALFFPEPVIDLLKKGKNVKLPKSFLRSPVFAYELPVYHISFLGHVIIAKGNTRLRKLYLRPKDVSLLIHLSFNLNRKISLYSLYKNFWPKSMKPARTLSHVLVRIRRALQLSAYSLRIQGDMLTWNFYLTSDYGNFEELLAQAKALNRAGEWHFARKEYRRAFGCFRGTPFRKMYDPWSEETRGRIIAQFETEAIEFIKQCKNHHNKKDVPWLQKKAKKILPSFITEQE